MAILGEHDGVVASDVLVAERDHVNLIDKRIVVQEMPKSKPALVLKHAGKQREHAACLGRTCFVFSALMLVEGMVSAHFAVSELSRPLHWSEVLRLGVTPLHGAALAMVALAQRRRVLHHGGKWLSGGRASYRAWRDVGIEVTLFLATVTLFKVRADVGELSESWISVSAGVAALVFAIVAVTWIFMILRERLLPRSMSRRPWLRAGW